jgi:hypothetical protein
VRIDDKQLESEDLAREEAKQRQPHMEAVDDLELRQLASEEVIDADREHAGQVLAAMSAILEKESITVSSLGLPDRERLALESLQAAVGGRDRNMGLFVFASDRRDMLEQALAILQPNLTDLDPAKLSEFHGKYHDLVVRIGDLRASLGDLEDAQDELLDAGLELPDLTKEGSDTDDTDLKDLPSTLSNGPARPEPASPKTSLEGPAIVEEPKPSTLYDEAPKR